MVFLLGLRDLFPLLDGTHELVYIKAFIYIYMYVLCCKFTSDIFGKK